MGCFYLQLTASYWQYSTLETTQQSYAMSVDVQGRREHVELFGRFVIFVLGLESDKGSAVAVFV